MPPSIPEQPQIEFKKLTPKDFGETVSFFQSNTIGLIRSVDGAGPRLNKNLSEQLWADDPGLRGQVSVGFGIRKAEGEDILEVQVRQNEKTTTVLDFSELSRVYNKEQSLSSLNASQKMALRFAFNALADESMIKGQSKAHAVSVSSALSNLYDMVASSDLSDIQREILPGEETVKQELLKAMGGMKQANIEVLQATIEELNKAKIELQEKLAAVTTERSLEKVREDLGEKAETYALRYALVTGDTTNLPPRLAESLEAMKDKEISSLIDEEGFPRNYEEFRKMMLKRYNSGLVNELEWNRLDGSPLELDSFLFHDKVEAVRVLATNGKVTLIAVKHKVPELGAKLKIPATEPGQKDIWFDRSPDGRYFPEDFTGVYAVGKNEEGKPVIRTDLGKCNDRYFGKDRLSMSFIRTRIKPWSGGIIYIQNQAGWFMDTPIRIETNNTSIGFAAISNDMERISRPTAGWFSGIDDMVGVDSGGNMVFGGNRMEDDSHGTVTFDGKEFRYKPDSGGGVDK
ncbi:hypothetical protein A2773_05530 [Candidatus Gottesmanbacteria bacterium RIFCSPHIGHO2_01_FULL_39_10]|uniref:Uncharacterized protein n=1 Tax=Candidatus Gottesmanbacteria bacterium RIFCSPHIGHO2_01_FULL_39_10 TaxID=1798375 RepID=A0A1F5ZQY8_9BACT|nr:MAG: hypothetical protein A2773_05530 [Candidatus Gottesmanbacteria bacterium RIFCSPHIGHO2_01_FULL_39_10]